MARPTIAQMLQRIVARGAYTHTTLRAELTWRGHHCTNYYSLLRGDQQPRYPLGREIEDIYRSVIAD